MESHFTQPQRQSPIGIVVMFFDTLRHYIRALWPILVIWIFNDGLAKAWLFAGTVAVFAALGVIAYLRYRNFTFYLDYENEEFIVCDGVFSKTKTAISLHKIQQVNISQSLLQKIIGVYALDVDTAGSSDKEGQIKAISHPVALELKECLLDNSKKAKQSPENQNAPAAALTAEDVPFIRISLLSLLKVGITSNYVKSFWLLLIFFFSASEHLSRFMGKNIFDDSDISHYVDAGRLLQVLLISILLLFLVVLLLNLVRIVLRYFDYRITRQKGSLLLSFGLINTKSTIIKPEKVQIIAYSRNYLQKKMDILQLKIKQATSGERDEHKSGIEIPGCNAQERDEILRLLFGEVPQKGLMLKPNFRKLGFALFLTIGLPLCGFYIFRDYEPQSLPVLNYVAPLYVLLVATIEFFKFRNNRLFINDAFIIKQSGAWDIKNEIIEPKKIQAITTSQLFWHKSLDIGSLTLHTAGGNISFQLGNYTTIKQYVNLWLYGLETSDSNWM